MSSPAYKPLNTGCALCKSTQNLSRCASCQISTYCSREHQVSHRASHKKACNTIKKARENLASEETELRNAPPDFMLPANVFETSIGRFWGIIGTRDYMRARFGLVEALMELKHERRAVVDALEHLMDLLRLCRSDNMGVREMVPHLMLRLDRDQEAYDFVKWYETEGQRGDYDWGNMDLPFLDVKGADVWEEVGVFCEEYGGLSFVVAVTFLKVKMLIDLRALKEAAAVGGKVPEELVLSIQKEVPRSPVVKELVGKPDVDFMALEEKLVAQIKQLANSVKSKNKYLWPAIHHPGGNLEARPGYMSAGTPEEMQVVLQYCYDCWDATPEAYRLVAKIEGGVYE